MAGMAGVDSKNASLLFDFFVSQKWLGWQGSNLRMTGPKPVALPLGDIPVYTYYNTLWYN